MTVDPLPTIKRHRDFLTTPWPALDELVRVELGAKKFGVFALSWSAGPHIPYLFAQAALRAGAKPLCVAPAWSPAWDGSMDVLRTAELPPATITGLDPHGRADIIIVDQFSRLYWENSPTGAEREKRVHDAGKSLLGLAMRTDRPVVVFPRWKAADGQAPAVEQLRSDGALEYDSDFIAMIRQEPEGAAAFHMVKNRYGPAPYTSTIAWPNTKCW